MNRVFASETDGTFMAIAGREMMNEKRRIGVEIKKRFFIELESSDPINIDDRVSLGTKVAQFNEEDASELTIEIVGWELGDAELDSPESDEAHREAFARQFQTALNGIVSDFSWQVEHNVIDPPQVPARFVGERAQADFVKFVFDCASPLVVTQKIGCEHIIGAVNPAFEELTGCSERELVGQSLESICAAEVNDIFKLAEASKRPITSVFQAKCKDGYAPVQATITPIVRDGVIVAATAGWKCLTDSALLTEVE